MANNFKWRRGAGIELLGQQGVVDLVGSRADVIADRACAMAHGDERAYKASKGFRGKKKMARAWVSTTSKHGRFMNLRNNTLQKSIGG